MTLPGLKSIPKMPKLKKPAVHSTGFRFVPKGEQIQTAWAGDEPWPGFITGFNSITEQHAYGALGVIFNNPRREDLMKPPFIGGFPDLLGVFALPVLRIAEFVACIGNRFIQSDDLVGPSVDIALSFLN